VAVGRITLPGIKAVGFIPVNQYAFEWKARFPNLWKRAFLPVLAALMFELVKFPYVFHLEMTVVLCVLVMTAFILSQPTS
jgi:hypothetical protein